MKLGIGHGFTRRGRVANEKAVHVHVHVNDHVNDNFRAKGEPWT